MRWLVRSSVRSRLLVAALSVALLVGGYMSLRDMPRSVLPEFRPPTVEIQTEALGLSAEEVERLITVPLEQEMLNGVAFLDFIRSESVPGLSRIEMIFEPGTPTLRARQVVNERLTQRAALADVANPPVMLQPVSSEGRLMLIGLSSKSRSLVDMSVLAKWTIRPRLLGVPGVSNVSVWGNREHQLQVQVDPARLQANGLSLDQVIRTTGNAMWFSPLTFLEASTPGTGGFFDTDTQRIGVQHTQPIQTAADLAQVIVDGAPKRLGDVATVVEDHQPLIGDATLPGGSGLLLVVEKFPEANTLEVTRNLEKALDDMAPGLSGIDVDTSLFQPARYIEESGDNFRTALLIGFGLLALGLFAFLRRLRMLLVVLVSVLLSMAAAISVLSARGETLNLMVLAGLALALVIVADDAVVSADAIRTGLGMTDGDKVPSIGTYVGRVLATRGALLYGTGIAFIVLLPILVLGGVAGAFLPSVALSYAGAVLASLLVSLSATPALAVFLQSRQRFDAEVSPPTRRLASRYEPVLARVLAAPKRTRALVGGLLVLGVALLPFVDVDESSFMPALKDRDLLIQWDGAPGTSLAEMRRITSRASAELKGLDGVEKVGGHVGRAITGDQIVGVNSGVLWVNIRRSADYGATVRAIEGVVDGYPGVDQSVLTYNRQQIDDVLDRPDGVAGKELTVRVFGYDSDLLKTQAKAVAQAVSRVGGIEDVAVELPAQEPTLQVEVDLDAAEEAGIKPGDVRRAASTLLSGVVVGNLFEQQKVFEVVVWGTPDTRSTVEKVQQLLIDLPDGGGQVRLSEVADVRIAPNPNVIRHQDVSRYVDVGMNVRGIGIDAAASDVRDRIRTMSFPSEYHAELLGGFEESRSERLQFLALVAAAAIGVFLLLQSAFGSWRLAGASVMALVAALSGGLAGIVLNGGALTIGSIAGLLAIFGLAARHAVLFVRRCHDLEGDAAIAVEPELVTQAARDRVAPTIMVAVGLGLLFLPFLVLGDRAGLEVVQPMAAVVIGGVITATVVDLFVVPVLYLRFGYRTADEREDFDMTLDSVHV